MRDLHEPLDGVSPSHVAEVADVVRRVVAAKLPDADAVDEVVQETLARVLASRRRLDDGASLGYAIVTARNLVASRWRLADTSRRNEHRLLEPPAGVEPEEAVVEQEEESALRAALQRLQPAERDALVAHEIDGRDTRSMAEEAGSTPGAIAAQLNRSRAKLRVEYLLEMHGDPPTERCRPVLLSLSAGDRRRQGDLDAGYHLLDCDFCATLSEPLFDGRARSDDDDSLVVGIRADADIVTARQRGRDLAIRAGFSGTEATVIATAISEIARNIVRFAKRGEISMAVVRQGIATGLRIVARDAGPGIEDLDLAMTVGFTTYGGRGLGLPGSRRLMDEFEITTETGRGTTVTMTKWHGR